MNKLPKYWCVRNCGSKLFRDTVIKYLSQFYAWHGDCLYDYYGFDGDSIYKGTNHYNNVSDFKNNPTVLTLEEFINLSQKSEEFILPEKWCIKNSEEINSILSEKFLSLLGRNILDSCKDAYWHYPEFSQIGCSSSNIKSGYTEITFEQFKKYVLKQTDMKKIKYYKILKKVWGINGFCFVLGDRIYSESPSLPYFESLGLLKDTTIFEPVYEEEFKVGDVVYINEAQIGAHGANNSFGIITNEEISAGINESFSVRVNIKGRVWGIGDPDKCDIRLATEKEVEDYKNNLLLEEAKKRYPVGTKFISSYDNCTKDEIINGEFFWYGNNHIVANSINGCSVYINGKWAEILPSFPQITINGYKAEFFDKYVKFGCAEISSQLFLELYAVKGSSWTNGREVESVTIGRGTFSKAQIKEIAEYYLNKK